MISQVGGERPFAKTGMGLVTKSLSPEDSNVVALEKLVNTNADALVIVSDDGSPPYCRSRPQSPRHQADAEAERAEAMGSSGLGGRLRKWRKWHRAKVGARTPESTSCSASAASIEGFWALSRIASREPGASALGH